MVKDYNNFPKFEIIKIVFCGLEMQNERTLLDYAIKNETKVYILFKGIYHDIPEKAANQELYHLLHGRKNLDNINFDEIYR